MIRKLLIKALKEYVNIFNGIIRILSPKPQKNLDKREITLPRIYISKNPALYKEFIAIDLETTGLSPINDKIIEIGAIKYCNGEIVDTFSTLINPGISIPKRISKINNITNDMVANEPFIEDILDDIILFIGDLPLVAHNARFDINFLNANLLKNDKSHLLNKIIDTLAISRKIFNLDNNRLGTVKKHLKLNIKDEHRALPDCQVAAAIYFKYAEFVDKKKIKESNRSDYAKPSVKSEPKLSHKKICEVVKNILLEGNKDLKYVRYRESSMYFQICYFNDFVRIKTRGNLIYMVSRKSKNELIEMYPGENITSTSKGETGQSRIFLNNEHDLIKYKDIILEDYDYTVETIQYFLNNVDSAQESFENYLNENCVI